MRVLIADERPSVRAALRAVLERDPYCQGIDEVSEAGDALVALGFGADVVVLGWGLQGMAAEALMKMMRSEFPDLVIVVLGRYGDARQAALDAGANCYVDTSETSTDFIRVLHDLCPNISTALSGGQREPALP